MSQFAIKILFLLYVLIKVNNQPFELQIWTEPGQYYGHFCQLSFKAISPSLNLKVQCLKIFAIKNIKFWDNEHSSLVFTQLNDNKEYINSKINPCNKQLSTSFYCMWMEQFYFPQILPLRRQFNQTHYSYQFRLLKALCPSTHQQNKITIRVEIPTSYDQNLLASPTIRINESYTFQLSNLTYRQIKTINLSPKKNYIVNELNSYKFNTVIQNSSLLTKWESIQMRLSSGTIIKVLSCIPECKISQNLISFSNSNFNNSIPKQFSYVSYQLYEQPPTILNFTINFQFIQPGSLVFKIVVRSSSTKFSQSFKTEAMPNTYQEYFGYISDIIYGITQQVLPNNSPVSNETNSSNNSNLPTNPNLPTDPNSPIMDPSLNILNSNYFNFLFVGIYTITIILWIFFRKRIYCCQNYFYILLILIDAPIQIIVILFSVDDIRLILIAFLVIQVSLNIIWFPKFVSIFCLSRQLIDRVLDKSIFIIFIFIFLDCRFYGCLINHIYQRDNNIFSNKSLYYIHIISSTLILLRNLLFLGFILDIFVSYINPLGITLIIQNLIIGYLIALSIKSHYSLIKTKESIKKQQQIKIPTQRPISNNDIDNNLQM